MEHSRARNASGSETAVAAETLSSPAVGDRVVCIDASASFPRLLLGGVYRVEAAFDGSPTVIVNGSYHSMDRFEAAP